MALWFTPPFLVPLGLLAMATAVAIYRAFAYLPPRMLAVTIAAGSQQPGWIR